MIWLNKELKTADLHELSKKTMAEHIGIEYLEVGNDFIKARTPVDHRTNQPYGLLHGGASCTLAETLGSIASAMVIDTTKYICVGIEINANHIRSAKSGYVYGIASPIHLGSSTHVWDIKIKSEEEKLLCISRLTVAILKKEGQK